MTDSQKKTKKPRTGPTVKDALLAFALDGIGGLKDSGVTPATVRKVIRELRKKDKDASAVETFAREAFKMDFSSTSRGRSAPTKGGERHYAVQSLKGDGAPFIRLPVSTLDRNKGQKVAVRFNDGKIEVVAA